MPAAVILCRLPAHLSPAEATAWLARELGVLSRSAPAGGLELIRLRSHSLRFPNPWAWAIRLGASEGAEPGAVLEAAAGAELLGDLQLLGMEPTILVPVDGELLP